MTYRLRRLPPAPFEPPFALDDAALAVRSARRVVVARPCLPCRVSREDAAVGAEMLVHHVSHDVATPFRRGGAIPVRRGEGRACRDDRLPAMAARRTIGLRGFGTDAMLRAAAPAAPGEADAPLAALLDDPAIAYVDRRKAAQGGYLARVERS